MIQVRLPVPGSDTTSAAAPGAAQRGVFVGRRAELSEALQALGIPPGPPRTAVPVVTISPVIHAPESGVLVEGDAGIGKSEFWRRLVAAVEATGVRVLQTRTTAAESELTYAGLTDLLGPLLDEAAGDLPSHQRTVLEVAMSRRAPHGPPLTGQAVGLAANSVLNLVAARSPLLLAIDDAQWLDEATTTALLFALRRSVDLPVRTLATLRTGTAVPETDDSREPLSAAHLLRRLADQHLLRRVRLGPLSNGELDEMVTGRLDLHLTPAQLHDLARQTGGNPFWALQAAAEVRSGPGQGRIVMPKTLAALIRRRLDQNTEPARRALTVTAALAEAPLDLVLAALRGEVGAPESAVDEAVAAGLLTETAGTLRPAHDLLGSVAAGSLPPARRRALHQKLAALVTDPERRVRHLALAAGGQPDESVAAAADEAAEQVRMRGALTAAADLAMTAARLTPDRQSAAHTARQARAAAYIYASGDAGTAYRMLSDLDFGNLGIVDWARAHRARIDLALLLHGRPAAVVRAEQALAEAGTDPLRRLVALGTTIDTDDGSDPSGFRSRLEEAMLLARSAETGHPVAAEALLSIVNAGLDNGMGLEHALLDRAETMERRLPWTSVPDRVVSYRGYLHKVVDDLSGSRRALHRAIALARAEGEEGCLQFLHSHLAITEFWAGDFPAARHSLAEAVPADTGNTPLALTGMRALVEAISGDPAEGARMLAGEPVSRLTSDPRGQLFRHHTAGVIALLQDDPERAADLLLRALQLAEHLGIREPGRRRRLEGDLGAALVRTGRLAEARTVAAEQRRLGELLGRDTLTGIGLRIDGLAAAADGDMDGAIGLLTRAVDRHRAGELRLEWGLSLLALGQAQRRNRSWQAAKATLNLAEMRFAEVGAPTLLAQVRAEQDTVGGARQGTAGKLTPTERRVATLVADGRTNREVAAVLFTSVRTVEGHLGSVYRKLGVRSRVQLAGLLRAGPQADD